MMLDAFGVIVIKLFIEGKADQNTQLPILLRYRKDVVIPRVLWQTINYWLISLQQTSTLCLQ